MSYDFDCKVRERLDAIEERLGEVPEVPEGIDITFESRLRLIEKALLILIAKDEKRMGLELPGPGRCTT